MRELGPAWSKAYATKEGRTGYQYVPKAHIHLCPLPVVATAVLGVVENWSTGQGANWVASCGKDRCGGFSTCGAAMNWVEEHVIGPVPKDVRSLVYAFVESLIGHPDAWISTTKQLTEQFIQDIDTLIPVGEPSTTDVVESKNGITNFKADLEWEDGDADDRPNIWLPREPFGHIAQKYTDELVSGGVDVTIMDLPTVDGTAIDAIIIEPKIKPIYGERPKRHLFLVEGEDHAD